jgi:hypothetical protein
MGLRYVYKDMLDNVVSAIACVCMNHQNQLEQMANGAMFATPSKSNDVCRWPRSLVMVRAGIWGVLFIGCTKHDILARPEGRHGTTQMQGLCRG